MRSAVTVVCCIGIWLLSGASSVTPSRSECIIGYQLDWSQVQEDHHAVRNGMRALPDSRHEIESLAGMVISKDGRKLYFQFKNLCDDKIRISKEIIDFWISEGMDIPKLSRIPDPIVPSLETIDIRGLHWRD